MKDNQKGRDDAKGFSVTVNLWACVRSEPPFRFLTPLYCFGLTAKCVSCRRCCTVHGLHNCLDLWLAHIQSSTHALPSHTLGSPPTRLSPRQNSHSKRRCSVLFNFHRREIISRPVVVNLQLGQKASTRKRAGRPFPFEFLFRELNNKEAQIKRTRTKAETRRTEKIKKFERTRHLGESRVQ